MDLDSLDLAELGVGGPHDEGRAHSSERGEALILPSGPLPAVRWAAYSEVLWARPWAPPWQAASSNSRLIKLFWSGCRGWISD